jgi:hypothetical protein
MRLIAFAAALGLVTAAAAQTGTTTMTATANTATSTGSYAGVGVGPTRPEPSRAPPRIDEPSSPSRPLLAIDAGLPETVGRLDAAGALAGAAHARRVAPVPPRRRCASARCRRAHPVPRR